MVARARACACVRAWIVPCVHTLSPIHAPIRARQPPTYSHGRIHAQARAINHPHTQAQNDLRTHAHTHAHARTHARTHPCTHPYTLAPIHASMRAPIHARTHACTHPATHTRIHQNDPRTHAHTHTCTHPTRTRKGTHARAKGTHARSYPPMRHTRAYTCAHARMRAHTHARAHTHPNVLTHALKHPSIHPSIHAPTQPSMHVWLPVRAYTCVCVGMCIHASVHTPVCSYQGSDSAYILNRRSPNSM